MLKIEMLITMGKGHPALSTALSTTLSTEIAALLSARKRKETRRRDDETNERSRKVRSSFCRRTLSEVPIYYSLVNINNIWKELRINLSESNPDIKDRRCKPAAKGASIGSVYGPPLRLMCALILVVTRTGIMRKTYWKVLLA